MNALVKFVTHLITKSDRPRPSGDRFGGSHFAMTRY